MKTKLERTFPLPASADVAWRLLQDVEAVAGCMPGARITERVDPQHYKGTVAVKFGPANLSFRGEVEVLSLDPETRTLALAGKGTDTTGTSAAGMELTARVEPVDAGSCNLLGVGELSVSGKAATFGARLMDAVADQVLRQFAGNFAERATALQAQAPVPEAARPLNGPALLWSALRQWLRSLFSGRAVGR